MYTVVVADDEIELLDAIVEKVEWEKIGFKIVGKAANGIEAIEMVEKLQPDLLVTDIRMPFISGIDLARQTREVCPTMNIAFLSGYDDFSYAQQAIQYNIISYLLKPISLEELTKELISIKQKMDEKNKDFRVSETNETDSSYISECLMPLLLDDAGINYSDYDQKKFENEMEKLAVKYGLKRSEDDKCSYIVIVVRIEDKNGNNCTLPQHVHSVNTILKKYVRYGSFYLNGKVVSVIAENKWEINKYFHIIVAEIIQSIEKIMSNRCVIGVGKRTDNLLKCSVSYREAITAASYSSDAMGAVHYITDMEHSNDFEYDYVKQCVAKLETYLKMGTVEQLSDYLNEMFTDFEQRKPTKADVNILIVQIVVAVWQAVSTVSDSGASSEFFSKAPIAGNLFMHRSFGDMKNEVTEFCLMAKNTISNQHKMNSEILCERALEIINNDFGDESLSLVSMSERLHVSPNYLSTIIKKINGDTFTNLLTEKRMQVARDCLLCSSMKVLEISNKCGYSDQHYFSYCFKKRFGVSPNKMREAAVQAERSKKTEEVSK